MSDRRLLVTGLSGAVGPAIRPALEARYDVAARSRSGGSGLADDLHVRGSIADPESIRPALNVW